VFPDGLDQAVESVGRSGRLEKEVVELLLLLELDEDEDEDVEVGPVGNAVVGGSEISTVLVTTGLVAMRHPWKVVVVVGSIEQPDEVIALMVVHDEVVNAGPNV
jgi:hypothetical protein